MLLASLVYTIRVLCQFRNRTVTAKHAPYCAGGVGDHLCAFSAEEIDTNSKLNWMLCINNIQHKMQRVKVVAKQVVLTVRELYSFGECRDRRYGKGHIVHYCSIRVGLPYSSVLLLHKCMISEKNLNPSKGRSKRCPPR